MEEDITNLSTSSSHRLPTVSASQALQKLSTPRKQWVPSGLSRLDEFLKGHPSGIHGLSQNRALGGFAKGQITEIYGPPGSGKTALALQAAAGALHAGESVVWIDCSHKLAGARVRDILSAYHLPETSNLPSSPPVVQSVDDLLNHLHHFTVPSLPHLLALACHPPSTFPPPGTSLIVVDGVPALFGAAFPDKPDHTGKSGKKNDDAQWASNRRFGIMGEFLSKLTKLAAVRNLAAVLLSQTSTKVKSDYGAILRPAIPSKTWADNINNRIVIFRDFFHAPPDPPQPSSTGARFAGLAKLNGTTYDRLTSIVPFLVDQTGTHEIRTDFPAQPLTLLPEVSPKKLKRKRNEVADSESEGGGSALEDEFDWVEDDAFALDEPPGEDLAVEQDIQSSGQEQGQGTSEPQQ